MSTVCPRLAGPKLLALKGPDARMARRCRSRDAVLAAVMLLWAEATDGRVAEGGTGRRLLGHGHHSSKGVHRLKPRIDA
jgi:hypothetical protein